MKVTFFLIPRLVVVMPYSTNVLCQTRFRNIAFKMCSIYQAFGEYTLSDYFPRQRSKVYDATQARIKESQHSEFNGQGQHMALSPWPGWPTSPNPNPTTTSDMHCHMKSLQRVQISDMFKLSFQNAVGSQEAGRSAQCKEHAPRPGYGNPYS